MSLPSELCLAITGSSPGIYLNCIKDDYLEYSGGVFSQGAKFTIERANSGGGLIHIRCNSNNKYWVRSSASALWITATAKEAIEDKSAWNCTLFKPILDSNSQVRFVHVQLGREVRLSESPTKKRLTINPQDSHTAVSRVVDYESLVKLPDRVAFLGGNDLYAVVFLPLPLVDMVWLIEPDLGSYRVPQEVFPNSDGDICIKDTSTGRFWRTIHGTKVLREGLILVNSFTGNGIDTLYRPIKVGDDVIVLRALNNNKFVHMVDEDSDNGALAAEVTTITKQSRLRIVEPIVGSSVSRIEYHLSNARIYDLKALVMATECGVNATSTDNTMTLTFTYTDTTSSTLSNSINVKAGVKTNFTAGFPFIAEGKIEVSIESSYTRQWGDTTTTTNTIQTSYTVVVPPRTRTNVTLFATQGKCDVPFSYTQIFIHTDGERVTRTLSDGSYTGVNNFNFHFETEEEPLPRSEWK